MADNQPIIRTLPENETVYKLNKRDGYEHFLVFYPDIAPQFKGQMPDLRWPVERFFMVGAGTKGHWRIALYHDKTGVRRTYINMQAKHKFGFGQLRIGPAKPGPDDYEIPVTNPQITLSAYVYVLLHPTENVQDKVFGDTPLCWFQYFGGGSTAGCRHWTESTARAFHRAGLLQGGGGRTVEQIIEEEGLRVERVQKADDYNPQGIFLTAPPSADMLMPDLN